MRNLTILKLGGSVVTDKETTDYNVRHVLLEEIFTHLESWRENNHEQHLLLVHGAGGHIHHLAKEYELKTSCVDDEEKIKKALEVQDVCETLNREIIGAGQSVGLPLVSLPTQNVFTNREAEPEIIDMRQVRTILEDNKIPILYGTMVTDQTRELSICSGDTVVTELSTLLKPKRILYASDIDGIYTDDPHANLEAELIENLTADELNEERIKLSGSHNVDVTGGLKAKLSDCEKLFLNDEGLETIEVYNGLYSLNTKKALDREPFLHTIITK